MAGIVKKIRTAAQNTTTYRIGLLQAKAYRALKQYTTKALAHLDISTVEWAFLGLLFDEPNGLRASEAALELGVEAPFITVLHKKLGKKKLVEAKQDEHDTRAKVLFLSKEGRRFVEETEIYLRGKMRPLVRGTSMKDILAYISVLQTIEENSSDKG